MTFQERLAQLESQVTAFLESVDPKKLSKRSREFFIYAAAIQLRWALKGGAR